MRTAHRYIGREGQRIAYKVMGEEDLPLLLLPSLQIEDSRVCRAQVDYFAGFFLGEALSDKHSDVQSGAINSLELTALGKSFIYVPLQNHLEKQVHVHHRLRRYGLGRRLDYDGVSAGWSAREPMSMLAGGSYPPVCMVGDTACVADRLAALL